MRNIEVLGFICGRFIDLGQHEGFSFLRLLHRVVGEVAILFLEAFVDCILLELLSNTFRPWPNHIISKSTNASIVTTFKLVLRMDFTLPDEFFNEKIR